MAYVIVDEEMGVFVGHAMGLAFWSMMDPVGQYAVPTVKTVEEGRLVAIRLQMDPDSLQYVECETDETGGATIPMMKKAGLGRFLERMEQEALLYMPAQGTA